MPWRHRVFAGLTISLCSVANLAVSGDSQPFAKMSATAFGKLAAADQKAVIAAIFEHRLQRMGNVHYDVLTRISNHEYKDDKPGKMVLALNGGRFRVWQLGRSYRVETDKGGPDVSQPILFAVAGFDSDSGVTRSFTRFTAPPRQFGRIDSAQAHMIDWDRYRYWQPSRGFLPIRGKARWDRTPSNGNKFWRTEEFTVEDAKLVGDVWMPTKVRELIRASTLAETLVNVLDTTVDTIEIGTVKPGDLKVEFAAGTEVVDALKGIAYVVDAKGGPSHVKPWSVPKRPVLSK